MITNRNSKIPSLDSLTLRLSVKTTISGTKGKAQETAKLPFTSTKQIRQLPAILNFS